MTVSSQENSGASHLKDGIIDLAAGTAGGIANVYAGQPLDTVKVKMQTFPHLYKNWVKCFTETFKADGVRGLYAGKPMIYPFHSCNTYFRNCPGISSQYCRKCCIIHSLRVLPETCCFRYQTRRSR